MNIIKPLILSAGLALSPIVAQAQQEMIDLLERNCTKLNKDVYISSSRRSFKIESAHKIVGYINGEVYNILYDGEKRRTYKFDNGELKRAFISPEHLIKKD